MPDIHCVPSAERVEVNWSVIELGSQARLSTSLERVPYPESLSSSSVRCFALSDIGPSPTVMYVGLEARCCAASGPVGVEFIAGGTLSSFILVQMV